MRETNVCKNKDLQQHEALCRRCGRCCYAKLVIGTHVIALDEPCDYLDTTTNLCTVYENRFQVNPRCLTIKQGIANRAFPDGCPYVVAIRDYKGPTCGLSPEEIGRFVLDRESGR